MLGWIVAEAVTLIDPGDEVIDAIALVTFSLVVLAVILLVARQGADRLGPATLGIRRTRFWPALGWLVAIGVGVNALTTAYLLLVGAGAESSTPAFDAADVPVAAAVLLVFGVAVLAPIAEEVVFRGYLFAALSRLRGGPWAAAAVSSVMFGAAHFLVYPLEILPALAIFGFGACVIFWFTGSLLPCIAVHAFNNAIAMGTLAGWDWQVPLVVIGAVTLSVLLLLPFARERAPQAAKA